MVARRGQRVDYSVVLTSARIPARYGSVRWAATPTHDDRKPDFRRFFMLVRAYLDDLVRSRFVYRPGMACVMCEYRDTPIVYWNSGIGLGRTSDRRKVSMS